MTLGQEAMDAAGRHPTGSARQDRARQALTGQGKASL